MLSTDLIKNALSAHSWLGLAIGAGMYLVCLSGAILTFSAELEQWEQADTPVVTSLDIQAATGTFNRFVAADQGVTPHMYLVLPTSASPKARLATEETSWFLNADGSLGPQEDNSWTSMLIDLHYYLHLPKSWGMAVVSALGSVLVALIITGLLAHPGILRDAFRLRRNSSRQLFDTDLHNRLSVWASPFHLMIAVTGAWFAFAVPLITIVADVEQRATPEALVAEVFGAEPELAPATGEADLVAALTQTQQMAPDSEPFVIIVHDAGTPRAHIGVSARHPGRLIWAENYLFTLDGKFLRTDHWHDGSAGRQMVYSIYRLHFGTFAGMGMQLLYLVMGLALSVIAASGVNIWLSKRRREDAWGDLWVALVWGTPIALAGAAIARFSAVPISMAAVFWSVLAACAVCTLALTDITRSRAWLRVATSASIALLLVVHLWRFGTSGLTGKPGLINLGLVLALLATVRLSVNSYQQLTTNKSHQPEATGEV
ncbi:MAG: PepSY-associated TM helix domain-containing protein [Pseudomonadota bacterium]